MAHPPPEFVELARRFVCARITDLRDVDLARWRFDFDLTFAALTATKDGTVLHRYGGRDADDPQSALSMASLLDFLRVSLAESANAPPAAALPPRRTIADLPLFQARDAEKRVDCVHCHTVNDFETRQAQADGTWRRERLWTFPDPARLGIEVARDDQTRIVALRAGSPAAAAGLAVGDRLLRGGDAPLATRADLQWRLDQLPATATTLPLAVERGGASLERTVTLPDGWKVADAREYAWRPMKWNLAPHPGFGGKLLTAEEKAAAGLAAEAFALRVNYLVDWGEHAESGRNAKRAGLAKGDVVLAVAGRSDFVSEPHFQAWFRLELAPGSRVELIVSRDGKRRTITLPVVE